MSFPHDFLWGVATSAYQIEGSPLADGAGPSIWHPFSHTPGTTLDGGTGDVACDHYHRMEDDVRMMHELGVRAYRFSVNWARVMPEGTGQVNEKGLDFYRRLVDKLLEHSITPNLTLYHWNLPLALSDRGGWVNRDAAGWFADYARVVAEALADRVPMWCTFNEPWVTADLGYVTGIHAPGHRSKHEGARVAHNVLRAHGAAVQAFRAASDSKIGIVVNLEPKHPASDSEADRRAAALADAYLNRHYLDPALKGTYPDELRTVYGEFWHEPSVEDMRLIHQPIDYVGVNYYSRRIVRHDPDGYPLPAAEVRKGRAVYTDMGWEVYPQGLTDVLTWVSERYDRPPLYVTENGCAFYDPERTEDLVDDTRRVAYFRDHLRAARAAIEQGADLRGYFAWSLMDNFEWERGYTKRFGIVHVDYETQVRTPKASARFYSDVIASNGVTLEGSSALLRDSQARGMV